jgi:hypothetical protein
MGNDLLKSELQKLQFEYRKILENTSRNIFQRDSTAVIDEINIFWHRNKKLVQSILRYLHKPYNAYVFTAATIMDIDDYEHYPFVSLGEYHFWDDPIYTYSKIIGKGNNNSFGDKMRKQVISTINDNIKILEYTPDIIYILPIRLLSNTDDNTVHNAAQQAFLSLFQNNVDFNYYRKNFKTISDIKNGLSHGIENSIIFSEDDDNSLDFETRFRDYKASTILPLKNDATDAEVFWFCIYSYLAQAFDIMLMCTEYQLIPYIRFEVAFKYMIRLSANFGDSKELTNMMFKCAIAFMTHHTFDKKKLSTIGFKEYYEMVRNFNFENKLFSDLQQEEISFFDPSIVKIKSIINKNFESMLAQHDIKQ